MQHSLLSRPGEAFTATSLNLSKVNQQFDMIPTSIVESNPRLIIKSQFLIKA